MSTIEKALDKMSENPDEQPRSQGRFTRASPGSESHSSSVEIDVAAMQEKGMLTPGATRSAIAEEYRHIKRPLLRNILSESESDNKASNIIMVSSALPNEGKTFTSVNLAMSIAMEMDHTCLLVDADVAKPSIMKTLGLHEGERKGVIDYLSDDSLDLSAVMLKTNVPKLNILPAGRTDTHSTELLSSESMRRLVRELSERYHDRIVIFDCPPLLVTSESHALMTLAGQVVVVVEALKTQHAAIKQAISFLSQDTYVGLVLNKSRSKTGYGAYYGGYGYGYGEER